MNLEKAREAFTNDPSYRALVELLVHQIEMLQMTPSEIREAAMFACIVIEERRMFPLQVYTSEQYKKFVLGEWDTFESQKDKPGETKKMLVCKKCHGAMMPGGGPVCKGCLAKAEKIALGGPKENDSS